MPAHSLRAGGLQAKQQRETSENALARPDGREHADNSIAELDKEIENLLFETRVRKEVVSDTVATLLQRAAAKRQSSLTVPEVPTLDPNPLRGGRVQ